MTLSLYCIFVSAANFIQLLQLLFEVDDALGYIWFLDLSKKIEFKKKISLRERG